MQRVLGLDIGTKRIGVALSDPFLIIAKPLDFIHNDEKAVEKIKSLIKDYNVSTIVVGLPLTLKGKEGEQAKYTYEFTEKIKESIENINIVFIDERFTSSLAEKQLGKKKNKKEKIDSLSAVFILQTYLDSLQLKK